MLYLDLSDKEISYKIANKLRALGNDNVPEHKGNAMPLEEWTKLFRKGDGLCFYSKEQFKDFADITFERIDPNKPYCKGNVVLVKLEYNQLKSYIDVLLTKGARPSVVTKLLKVGIKVVDQRIADDVKAQNEKIARDMALPLRLSMMSQGMKRGRFNRV